MKDETIVYCVLSMVSLTYERLVVLELCGDSVERRRLHGHAEEALSEFHARRRIRVACHVQC